MNEIESISSRVQNFKTAESVGVQRFTALWGFSEAALGGVLHALKIPFTGAFLGSAAIIFIFLIAKYSKEKNTILRSTLIVILVKAFVSPYSPLTAYFAVALQGLTGYLFYSAIKYERLAALLHGIVSLLFSALQKLFILTLLFGTEFWKSIDIFTDFVLSQIPVLKGSLSVRFSLILIGFYTALHLIAGIYVGIKAAKISDWIKEKKNIFDKSVLDTEISEDLFAGKKRVKKKWWKKRSGLLLIFFFAAMLLISFFDPELGKNKVYEILIMILRSVAITIIWFSVISPFAVKKFRRFLEKNNFRHASEVNDITSLFPDFRTIINYCWRGSKNLRGINRFKIFFADSFTYLLFWEEKR